MDLTALHHFYWVVREGNFSSAARALRIAQPAVSRAVMRLEDTLGEKLLIRHKRHVELTPAGNGVFLECQIMFEAAERVANFQRDKKPLVSGALRFVAGDVISEHLLAPSLYELALRYPEVYPAVTVGPSGTLTDKIASGEAEFGLFFHVPSPTPEVVRVQRLRSYPFRLVIAAKANADKKLAPTNFFVGSREVDSPDTRTYPSLEKLRRKHPRAAIRYSSNHLGLHKHLALEGAGTAILPEFSVREELKRRRLKDALPGEKFEFDLKLVTHKQRPLSPAAKEFLEIFKKLED